MTRSKSMNTSASPTMMRLLKYVPLFGLLGRRSAERVMHPRNLGIDFPLDRLTLIERGFRPSAEILLLQLPHESYFVEELPRVHFSAIL